MSIAEFKKLKTEQRTGAGRNDREYQICLSISQYLKLKYPNVNFHFDYAGLQLTKTQSGKMKAIQGKKGFPDLAIYESKVIYEGNQMRILHGLFIEIKAENTKLVKKDRYECYVPATPHLWDQQEMLKKLEASGYKAVFACGTQQAIDIIDEYLNNQNQQNE